MQKRVHVDLASICVLSLEYGIVPPGFLLRSMTDHETELVLGVCLRAFSWRTRKCRDPRDSGGVS